MNDKPNLSMSFDEFAGLEPTERQSMFDNHYDAHHEAVDAILQEHGWAIFVEGSSDPIQKGKLDDYPSDEQLLAWGQEHGGPIFPHSADVVPESMDLGADKPPVLEWNGNI